MSSSSSAFSRLRTSLFARAIVSFMLFVSVVLPAAIPFVAYADATPGAGTYTPGAGLGGSGGGGGTGNPSQPTRDILAGCTLNPVAFRLSTCLAGVIYFFFVYITGFVAAVAGFLFDFTTDIALEGPTYANSFINNAWTISRDLANMAFVFLLIYLAFTLILDIAHSGVGKQLAKIIAVALLINFSFFFSRVVIDASNILAHTFYDAIGGEELGNTKGFSTTPMTVKSLSANILSGINVQRLLDDNGNEGTFNKFQKSIEDSNGWINFAMLASVFILFGIMNFILIFIFLTASVQMIGRVVRLWLVIMLAPIGFIAWIIPGLGSIATRWWNTLLKSALFAPAFLLGIYIIITLIKGGLLNGLSAGSVATALGNGDFSSSLKAVAIIVVMITIRLGIVIGLLFGALKMGDYFGQTTSKAAIAGFNKYGGGWATRGAGWVTGYAVGGIANNLDKRIAGTRAGNTWAGFKFRQYALQPVANKKFLGAESRVQRDARVKKEEADMKAGLQKIEDKASIAKAGNEDEFAKLLPEEQARIKQRIAGLSKTEMESLGGATLASIAQYLKPKQLEVLEKSVEDGKLKKEELVTIKTNFNGRIAIGKAGSTEASINEIDKAAGKLGDLEASISDPEIKRRGETEIARVLQENTLVGDKELEDAQKALTERVRYISIEYADAMKNGEKTRAANLDRSKANAETQLENVKKMREKAKELGVGAGNTFERDANGNLTPKGGNTLSGQYRTQIKPTINSFSASPSGITSGSSSTLSWSVSGSGVTVKINPGFGTVSGTSQSVSPANTTTYTLTAVTSTGSATATTKVTVNTPGGPATPPPPPPPPPPVVPPPVTPPPTGGGPGTGAGPTSSPFMRPAGGPRPPRSGSGTRSMNSSVQLAGNTVESGEALPIFNTPLRDGVGVNEPEKAMLREEYEKMRQGLQNPDSMIPFDLLPPDQISKFKQVRDKYENFGKALGEAVNRDPELADKLGRSQEKLRKYQSQINEFGRNQNELEAAGQDLPELRKQRQALEEEQTREFGNYMRTLEEGLRSSLPRSQVEPAINSAPTQNASSENGGAPEFQLASGNIPMASGAQFTPLGGIPAQNANDNLTPPPPAAPQSQAPSRVAQERARNGANSSAALPQPETFGQPLSRGAAPEPSVQQVQATIPQQQSGQAPAVPPLPSATPQTLPQPSAPAIPPASVAPQQPTPPAAAPVQPSRAGATALAAAAGAAAGAIVGGASGRAAQRAAERMNEQLKDQARLLAQQQTAINKQAQLQQRDATARLEANERLSREVRGLQRTGERMGNTLNAINENQGRQPSGRSANDNGPARPTGRAPAINTGPVRARPVTMPANVRDGRSNVIPPNAAGPRKPANGNSGDQQKAA